MINPYKKFKNKKIAFKDLKRMIACKILNILSSVRVCMCVLNISEQKKSDATTSNHRST